MFALKIKKKLQEMIKDILPYTQLWETAQNWLVKSEEWLQGTFLSIDPEKLTEELQTMWRKVCKFIESNFKIYILSSYSKSNLSNTLTDCFISSSKHSERLRLPDEWQKRLRQKSTNSKKTFLLSKRWSENYLLEIKIPLQD